MGSLAGSLQGSRKETKKMVRVISADISLNHGGFCYFVNGELKDYRFFTNVKKYVTIDSDHGVLLEKKKKDEYKFDFDLRRCGIYLDEIEALVYIDWVWPDYFVLEGYAVGASNTNSILQIAELTGMIKMFMSDLGAKIRIHDPMSVKMFGAGKGNATKQEMLDHVGDDLFRIIPDSIFKRGKKDAEGPGIDVVDAYWLGRMLNCELDLREGKITLDQLTPKQIEVFNRVTKTYPVNVLSRPFIGENW